MVHVGWEVVLPVIQEGFPQAAPYPVKGGSQGDGSLDGLVLG